MAKKEDIFRPGGLGKFDTYATEHIYELSLDGGADEECGDVESTNWYGLMKGPFEHPQLKKYRGAILEQTNQGFVNSEFFTSKKELDRKWKKICSEVEAEMTFDG